jgi:hypothetical protein
MNFLCVHKIILLYNMLIVFFVYFVFWLVPHPKVYWRTMDLWNVLCMYVWGVFHFFEHHAWNLLTRLNTAEQSAVLSKWKYIGLVNIYCNIFFEELSWGTSVEDGEPLEFLGISFKFIWYGTWLVIWSIPDSRLHTFTKEHEQRLLQIL